MPLKAADIYQILSEWPRRGACTEDEMMARESLVTLLVGEPDVDVSEEGLHVPQTHIPFLWMMVVAQVATVSAANWAPYIAFFSGLLVFSCYFLFVDGRLSPLVWWPRKKVSANIVADKGAGKRLILILAAVDTPAFSIAEHLMPVRFRWAAFYIVVALYALGFIVPALALLGHHVSILTITIIGLLLISGPLLQQISYMRAGFVRRKEGNEAGVAAAMATASNLWRSMPACTEVRLILTTGQTLGAQHYWRLHRYELKTRDTTVISFDGVGSGKISFNGACGQFVPLMHPVALTEAAETIAMTENRFNGIIKCPSTSARIEAACFLRDKIPAFSLMSRGSPKPKPIKTHSNHDVSQMELCVDFAETFIRYLCRDTLSPKPAEEK